MPKVIHNFTINAPIHNVWEALTTTEIVQKWSGSKIKTNWKVGSPIDYTCYNEDGTVLIFEGRKMHWLGTITSLDEDSKYSVVYPPETEHGILDEEYALEKISDGETLLRFTSNYRDQQVADNYAKGMDMLFGDFIKLLETNQN